ncbi:MAG TPA: hypothetical protein VMU99_04555 [Acidimicrobiales bacterium]|nr:hypothetical protein [Acidimicrobiales bacterium]
MSDVGDGGDFEDDVTLTATSAPITTMTNATAIQPILFEDELFFALA